MSRTIIEIKSYGKTTFGKNAFRGAKIKLPTVEQPRFKDNEMRGTFYSPAAAYCGGYTSDISFWNTSNIRSMDSMFEGTCWFPSSPSLNKWDVSKVTSMHAMFEHSRFNSDLNEWNTSSVKDMSYMFYEGYQPMEGVMAKQTAKKTSKPRNGKSVAKKKTKRNTKDSVFTHLFSFPEYQLGMYQVFHPGGIRRSASRISRPLRVNA